MNGNTIATGVGQVFWAIGGVERFIGGSENDIFVFSSAALLHDDLADGGDGFDVLIVSGPAILSDTDFCNITNMEEFNLSNGGNNVTLTNGLVAGSSIPLAPNLFVVVDGTGNDTVDGSGINNGKQLLIISNGGNDTFKGSTSNDTFRFDASQLTSGDTVDGGSGFDVIEFTNAGTVAASAFQHVSHVEALALDAGGTVTIDNAFIAASDTGQIAVLGGAGNDDVEAGGITNGHAVAFFANGGNDTFHGGNGDDFISIAAGDLTAADTVVGGNGGFDFLHVATAGTITAANLAGVSQIEGVIITGASTITLTNAQVGGSTVGFFAVVDGDSNDTVDASGVTGMNLAFFEVGGNDTFLGGSGDDLYWIAPSHLNGLDTLTGGAGNDILAFSSNGTVSAAQLAGVSQIEVVELTSGGSVTLANTLTGSGALSAVGSGAADTFDASGVSAYGVTFFGQGGADTLIGGAGNDAFRLPDSAFAQVDGNGGLDSIVLTTTGQTFDLTANAAKIHDIEVISLSVASGATLTLSAADIPQVNAAGHSLYVLGGGDDEVIVGDTWSLVETDHTNDAVAPGVHFLHFYNAAANADLYLSDLLSFPPVQLSEQNSPLPDMAVPKPVAVFAEEPTDKLAPSITAGPAGHAAVNLDPTSNAVLPFATLAAGISDPDGHSIQALVLALTTDTAIDVGSAFSGHFASAPGWLDLTNAGFEIAVKAGLHVTGAQTGWMAITGFADESIYTQLLHEVSCTSPTGEVPNEYIQAFATDHDGLISNGSVVSLQHPNLDALL